MTFLAPMADVTFETMPNETGGYSSLCWFGSRVREFMDGIKNLSDPTTRDDGSVFPSGGVTKNGKVLEGNISKTKVCVGGLVGSDIFRIALFEYQLTVVNGGKSNCRQVGQDNCRNICLAFYVLYIRGKLCNEGEMLGLAR